MCPRRRGAGSISRDLAARLRSFPTRNIQRKFSVHHLRTAADAAMISSSVRLARTRDGEEVRAALCRATGSEVPRGWDNAAVNALLEMRTCRRMRATRSRSSSGSRRCSCPTCS